MFNFPLIARIQGLERESSAPSAKYLYDATNEVINDFTSTWTQGAQVVYTSNNTLYNVSGDFHTSDEYIYRLENGVISKVGRSLFNTSFGSATNVFTDCELTTQEYIFYSQTYSKWKANRWDEDEDWFNGTFLQNSNEVTYTDGSVSSTVRYCPYSYSAYSSCASAGNQGTADYTVYADPSTPISSWTNGTNLYGNYGLSSMMYPSSFYVNNSGTPTFVTLTGWELHTLNSYLY